MNNDFKARMARYEQELLRLRQRSHLPETTPPPEVPATNAVPPPPPPVVIPPRFQGNITQEQNSGDYPPRTEPEPITVVLPDAPLTLRVVNAQNGAPVKDAMITIDRRTPRGREPVHVRFTDRNGGVPALTLPVGEAEAVYDILAAAAGFYREMENGLTPGPEGIERRIALIPLPEL